MPKEARFLSLIWPGAKAVEHAPVLGPIYSHFISGHNLLVYVALLSVPLTHWLVNETRFGLRLRAVGEKPEAVDTAGISVAWLRYRAVLLCGVLTGLAGAYVSTAQNAAFTVIFIHGRDGDRRLGANDYSFGGNFNRLKNLVAGNGGVYYSPSVRTFDADGVAAIAGLIRYAGTQSQGRPVILACASMGSQICWGVARDGESVKRLKGMVIMSGVADPDFSKTPFYKARLPLWFAHGSRDPVYAAASQQGLFESLYKAKYPTHFTLFRTGNHGTPIRMIDWRRALNWIFAS